MGRRAWDGHTASRALRCFVCPLRFELFGIMWWVSVLVREFFWLYDDFGFQPLFTIEF